MTESLIERDARPPEIEVLCVGETMIMVSPTPPGSLTAPETSLTLAIGGAESNVAMSLAQLGIATGWWSRLSDDPLGHFVRDAIAERDVAVEHVQFDDARRTGLYLKDQSSKETRVTYYRDGSAASAMSPAHEAALPQWARLLHISGITPALSSSADAFIEVLLDAPRGRGRRVSFDVNHRPQLWRAEQAGPRLLDLSARADIVFVGLDEAHRVWGTSSPEEVRALLPEVSQVIVKDGPRAASAYTPAGVVTVSTPPVEVTEIVGAGDAFAAGYLAADLRGLSTVQALMAGHLAAREAIKITTDVPVLPDLETLLEEAPRVWVPDSRVGADTVPLKEERK